MPLNPYDIPVNVNASEKDKELLNRLNRENARQGRQTVPKPKNSKQKEK